MSTAFTTNRLAVFSMMKNEADIIGDFLDQVLELFDVIYICDHESRDGTYEMCQQIAAKDDRVHLYRLRSSGYPQAQVTTWFTHEIFRREQPEWLFLLDTDEFLPFNSRAEFRAALSGVQPGKCLSMRWRNLVPADLAEWRGLSAATFLEASRGGPFPKVVIHRAVAEQLADKLTVFQGNHGTGLDEKRPAETQDAPFNLFHLPYRSLQQAEQKLLLGNLAYYNDAWRRIGKGFHWVRMADEYYVSSADKRAALVREQVLHYSWPTKGQAGTNGASFEACPHQFRFPKGCDRSMLERGGQLTPALILWREVERRMATEADTASPAMTANDFAITDSEGGIVKIAANGAELSGTCSSVGNAATEAGNVVADGVPPGATNTSVADASTAPTPIQLRVFHSEAATQLALLKQVFAWMNTPPRAIPISAWNGHLAFLHALIGLARPRRIVELGVDRGCSFFAMCDACQAHEIDAEVIGVDHFVGDPHAGDHGGDALFEELTSRALAYPMARLIRADFNSARQRVPDGVVDLLHIDGYHTLEAVSADFSTWFSSLSDRGICMFHDIGVRERNFGVYLLWDELKSKWPSIEFTHSFGLGVLFVGQNQPQPVKDFLEIWNASELVREAIRSAAELFASTFPARLQALDAEKEIWRRAFEVEALHKSLSWRVTAPLRFAADFVQRLRKGRET
ncbi:MAG TPA: class I SAM-dependent methyltransferase [Candidatus Binatia bacterium]|nr:class I SAM-dependent methyltransferase [Candidatus Binatia bacterium]